MKRIMQFSAIVVFAAFLISCTGAGGSVVEPAKSYTSLGNCSSENEGVVRPVSDENANYRCEDGTWKKVSGSSILDDDESPVGGDDDPLVVDGRFCSMETDYNTYVKMESKLFSGGSVTVSVKRKGDVATATLTFEDVSSSRFLSVCNEWKNKLADYMSLDASAKCNEDTKKMSAEGEYIGKKTPEKAFAAAAEEAEDYCRDLND